MRYFIGKHSWLKSCFSQIRAVCVIQSGRINFCCINEQTESLRNYGMGIFLANLICIMATGGPTLHARQRHFTV
jgi:hypothetical protein